MIQTLADEWKTSDVQKDALLVNIRIKGFF